MSLKDVDLDDYDTDMTIENFTPEERTKIIEGKLKILLAINEWWSSVGRCEESLYPLKGMPKIFVAGGFFPSFYHDETPKDLDIYFEDKVEKETIKRVYEKSKKLKDTVIGKTDYSLRVDLGLDYEINLITKPNFVGKVGHVIDQFDFTVCQSYYQTKFGAFYISRDILDDIQLKRLVGVPTRTEKYHSAFRLHRYINEKNYKVADRFTYELPVDIGVSNRKGELVTIDSSINTREKTLLKMIREKVDRMLGQPDINIKSPTYY